MDELEEGEHEQQDSIGVEHHSITSPTSLSRQVGDHDNDSHSSSSSSSSSLLDKHSFNNIFKTFLLDTDKSPSSSTVVSKQLLVQKLSKLNICSSSSSNESSSTTTSSPVTSSTTHVRDELCQLLILLNGHNSVDDSLRFIMFILNNTHLSTLITNDQVDDDLTSTLFNVLSNNNNNDMSSQWMFVGLLYEYAINRPEDSAERMESIIFFANLFERDNSLPMTRVVFHMLLAPLTWTSSHDHIHIVNVQFMNDHREIERVPYQL
ncbi:hypothetical protein SAMD00019534_075040 [Acytostelium subglobosum LB1]|uniref:hypothetical protein n=1 Tax=Acytostelium subglobosum LB1 TaxID=1410327 RepID=UPI00064481E3|nr:hypothetical protein SAMD00019534_075040 [Acytostelium subglobosum LB1]GAM24329.1 hypothetical protein SAMD00019534_075040 [Acytostelium subglobosum LB1]|eukprot:XP_012752655.1 hypothetical protein SAMD00019534_075040 [Acytostelium subglobosum LB1]